MTESGTEPLIYHDISHSCNHITIKKMGLQGMSSTLKPVFCLQVSDFEPAANFYKKFDQKRASGVISLWLILNPGPLALLGQQRSYKTSALNAPRFLDRVQAELQAHNHGKIAGHL
jgi:hypothetical protein